MVRGFFAQIRGFGWITLAQECSIEGEAMRFLFAQGGFRPVILEKSILSPCAAPEKKIGQKTKIFILGFI